MSEFYDLVSADKLKALNLIFYLCKAFLSDERLTTVEMPKRFRTDDSPEHEFQATEKDSPRRFIGAGILDCTNHRDSVSLGYQMFQP